MYETNSVFSKELTIYTKNTANTNTNYTSCKYIQKIQVNAYEYYQASDHNFHLQYCLRFTVLQEFHRVGGMHTLTSNKIRVFAQKFSA
jgi:hypothetical protein